MKKLLLFVCAFILFVPSEMQGFDDNASYEKIVISSNKDGYVNIRSSATTASDIKGTIVEGDNTGNEYAYYLGEEGNWIKIKTEDGMCGYVHKSQVSILDSDAIDTVSPVPSAVSPSQKEEPDLKLTVIILLAVAIIIFLSKMRKYRCPSCKKLWAMRTIDVIDMGVSSKTTTYNSNGSTTRYSRKVKKIMECKHCGHKKIVNTVH